MKYNPLAYIRSEKDILKLVNALIMNTKGEGEKAGEDFWVAPWFMQNILFESETNPGITSYLFCGILLFAILTGSVAVGFNQSIMNTTAALYQGGD